jgi:sortase (surface protein transpeptidase)
VTPATWRRLRLAAVAILAGLVAGCAVAAPSATLDPSLDSSQRPGSAAQGAQTGAGVTAPVPRAVAITIPAIEAHSSLVPIGLRPDGTLNVPPVEEPGQAAYYDGAPMPGAVGPALIVGHVNGRGLDGVFVDLHRLGVGDEVLIEREGAEPVRFVVTDVEQVAKAVFPWERVLGETERPELRLVTCTGEFSEVRDSYTDNLIVSAIAA